MGDNETLEFTATGQINQNLMIIFFRRNKSKIPFMIVSLLAKIKVTRSQTLRYKMMR